MCIFCWLTHWGRDKMAAVSQTTLSNAFSWTKTEFRFKFHWSLFLRVQLAIIQHWFRKWLVAGQATSHYLNQWWLVYWRIYASLGLNELMEAWSLQKHATETDTMGRDGGALGDTRRDRPSTWKEVSLVTKKIKHGVYHCECFTSLYVSLWLFCHVEL